MARVQTGRELRVWEGTVDTLRSATLITLSAGMQEAISRDRQPRKATPSGRKPPSPHDSGRRLSFPLMGQMEIVLTGGEVS